MGTGEVPDDQEATRTPEREPHLARANRGIERLPFFFRLARGLQFPDPRRCEHAAAASTRPDASPGLGMRGSKARMVDRKLATYVSVASTS